ncbi:LLM class flavin-dependent oxidoreductase [Actinoplanes sp. NPDC051343]|uniref:LLM class flavin-dependent oxidoreductase n=1 Tax=Actinoplanes sp. NPDC051343 TaxID=3363906 RepID=UPI00378FF77F
MTTLGAIALPNNPPETLREIATTADRAGLDELWLWEDCFLNGGVAAASAALAWTTDLRVGLGIMPVPFRNVALCAMEIATMARMSGGRAMPGIGHGVQSWMAQVGVKAGSPLTLLQEYASSLRSLLHGETVTVDGRYVHLDAVRLDHPSAPAPGLLVAATGPRTLALAGQVGDGTVLSGGTSPADVASARELIAQGDDHDIIVFVPVASGPHAAARLRAAAEHWGQSYIGVGGGPADIAEGVREFAAAGATRVILNPLPDEPSAAEFVRFAADRVAPLVKS